MTKRYKLKIPDGCKVESVSRVEMEGKDAIIVTLAPEFDPKPGDYVATDDGIVGVMTKNGPFVHDACNNQHFTRYANDVQKKAFDKLLKEAGLMYDRYSEDVIPLPKEGDLCIFWNTEKKCAYIRVLKDNTSSIFRKDSDGHVCINCLKFVSKEQFKKLISE